MFHSKQARPVLAIVALSLSIFSPAGHAADNIGILGAHPRWNVLEKYQETITHDEFASLIDNVYCTHGFASDLIAINDKDARLLTNRDAQKFFTLRFAKDKASAERVPHLWQSATSLPPLKSTKLGLCIGFSTRGIGGNGRKWRSGGFRSVTPAGAGRDLTLCGRDAGARITKIGRTGFFVRNSTEPITAKRPDDFRSLQRKFDQKWSASTRRDVLDPNDPAKEQTIRWQSETCFTATAKSAVVPC
jgi:hypothetical protein